MPNLSDKIQGLLGDPTFNLGVGLLAHSGPQRGPKRSFGQVLAPAMQFANQQMSEVQQLQAQRQAIQQRQRQNKATNQLGNIQQRGGLLSPVAAAQALTGNVPNSIARPGMLQNATAQMANAQSNHVMGLLAQANPQAFTQAAIQQQFAPQQQQRLPSSVQEVMAVTGLQPGQPGFMEAWNEMQNPSDPLREIQGRLAAEQLRNELQEDEEARQSRLVEQRTLSTARQNAVDEIAAITDLLEQTEGTSVEPGFVSERIGNKDAFIADLQRVIGFDESEARKRATQYDLLNKGFDRLLNKILPEDFTNQTFTFLRESNAGIGMQSGANASIMIDTLKGIMADDYNSDGEYDLDRDYINGIIERLSAIKNRSLGIPPLPEGAVLEE